MPKLADMTPEQRALQALQLAAAALRASRPVAADGWIHPWTSTEGKRHQKAYNRVSAAIQELKHPVIVTVEDKDVVVYKTTDFQRSP